MGSALVHSEGLIPAALSCVPLHYLYGSPRRILRGGGFLVVTASTAESGFEFEFIVLRGVIRSTLAAAQRADDALRRHFSNSLIARVRHIKVTQAIH